MPKILIAYRTHVVALIAAGLGLVAAGCASKSSSRHPAPTPAGATVDRAADVVIAPEPGTPRPPFAFSRDDEQFLSQVHEGAFWWMWDACDPASGLTRDRASQPFSSTAAVGFALAGLPAGVERGWVTRAEAEARALTILRALEKSPRVGGLFYHFIDGSTAKLPPNMPEGVVSTVDSAWLFAGMLVASSYFGGEVAQRADAFVADANWNYFVDQNAKEKHWQGFVSLGWEPESVYEPQGKGKLLPYYWVDAGDEQRMVMFLGVAAPRAEHALPAERYYQLRRHLGEDPGVTGTGNGVLVSYIPWSGALFTSVFANLFLDYRAIGVDDPASFGVPARARIDWWENSRRAVLMHRSLAIRNPKKIPTLSENAWGLTASDYSGGYLVPGVYPTPRVFKDERPHWDFEPSDQARRENFGDGTIAPYGAGCAIMFEPKLSIAALRHYRSLKDAHNRDLVWRWPRPKNPGQPQGLEGYGFLDSFNLGTGWVAEDYVGIDQGPLALAIENARTGLIWKLFQSHPYVKQGLARLRLNPNPKQFADR